MRVCPVTNSGTLPLICESISAVAIGCVCVKTCPQKGLDSYQKEDLAVLRDHWLKALIRRKKYFDEQIQMLTKKQGMKICFVMFLNVTFNVVILKNKTELYDAGH